MEEEQKEFWGTNKASLLATSGFLCAVFGNLLIIKISPLFILLSVVGSILIIKAIQINRNKDQSVKWRKANMIFHVSFLILSIVGIIIAFLISRSALRAGF